MRFLNVNRLCRPALLYLVFVVFFVGLDLASGLWWTAGATAVGGLITTYVLEAFCAVDLGIVAWVWVATPFIITALATAISMGLKLDAFATEHFTGKRPDLQPSSL